MRNHSDVLFTGHRAKAFNDMSRSLSHLGTNIQFTFKQYPSDFMICISCIHILDNVKCGRLHAINFVFWVHSVNPKGIQQDASNGSLTL